MNSKKVVYFSLPKLLSKLRLNKIDGAFIKELERIENKHLLYLDHWRLASLDTDEKLPLLQIIAVRQGRHSTIITFQLTLNAWHPYINVATIADAILIR